MCLASCLPLGENIWKYSGSGAIRDAIAGICSGMENVKAT